MLGAAWRRRQWWCAVDGADLAHARGSRLRRRRPAATTRSCTSRGTTPRRTAPGPARGCRPRPSGSAPPAAGWSRRRYPWGDELAPRGRHRCNIWQGDFPRRNTTDDGHLGTAPVKSYRPNGFGLLQMAGNVWEWCADGWSVDLARAGRAGTRDRPAGPPDGASRVMRGGCYLCHESYCNRYRVAARRPHPGQLDRQHRLPVRRRSVVIASRHTTNADARPTAERWSATLVVGGAAPFAGGAAWIRHVAAAVIFEIHS